MELSIFHGPIHPASEPAVAATLLGAICLVALLRLSRRHGRFRRRFRLLRRLFPTAFSDEPLDPAPLTPMPPQPPPASVQPERIRCEYCHCVNDPGSRHCASCGAAL